MKLLNNPTYPIDFSPLYRLYNKRKLERLLYLPKYSLNNVKRIIEYYSFSRPKSDGSKREITAPRDELKSVQRRIFSLLSRIEKPEWLISGTKGKSYIDNAKFHQFSDYALTVDIRKFYPSCTREYVFNLFHCTFEMPKDVAAVFADLLTLNNEIPTGCPTSQLIAYFAYKDMFVQIQETAVKYGCIFSLYVDDMAFSSKDYFSYKGLLLEVGHILHMYGHRIKTSKVKFYKKDEYKLITGVVLNPAHETIAPNKLRFKIHKNMTNLLNNPESENDERLRRTLRGQLVCAKSIESGVFPELYRAVASNRI